MGAFPLPFVVGDRWRLEAFLARGGGSSVYRATDLETGADVAVKLGEPWRSGSMLRDRFEREAAALALIGSEHVVRVLAEGDSQALDAPFLVMERLTGNDLAQEIKRRGVIPPAETCGWFAQAADALELAHGVGIVHRDLKPSNLFLHETDGSRVLKILDFGLVKSVDDAVDRDAAAGTPAYMAPEQALGHGARTGPATDVWAMGMVCVTMLTGERYWRARSTPDTLDAIRHEPLVSPTRRWPWLGRAFDEWFRRSCDRVAERRFRLVALQAEALERALRDVPAIEATVRATWDERTTMSFSLAAGASASFPPEPPTPHHVPRPLGRDAEMRELAGRLGEPDGALVTVTGAAGAGKTCLARAVIAALEPAFPDGVWLVPLAPLRRPEEVLEALAEAIAPGRDPVLPAVDQLAASLGEKRALVCLDNFEHLMAARAGIAELRARCPHVAWLVTSRAPLGIDGESRVPLGPLAVPAGRKLTSIAEGLQYSAVQLFVARARAASADFELRAANVGEIGEICRRLEGLPLAIELAAARQMALGAIERRLEGEAERDPEAATIHATLAWSTDLLGEPARALLRRLSVCPAAIGGDTARALFGAGDLDAAVTALVDASLLDRTADEPPRLVMLQTVRAFGLEMLEAAGETGLAHGRALAHYQSLVARADPALRGPDARRALEALDDEHDNIRTILSWAEREDPEAALELATRMTWFWYLRGHYREGRALLEGTLARARSAPAATRRRALLGAGQLALLSCDYAAAEALTAASAELARAQGDLRGLAAAEQTGGSIARERGDTAGSAARHEKSRAAWASLGDRREEARALNYLAFAAWLAGDDLAGSAELAGRALEVFREIGDAEGCVWSLLNLAASELWRGDVAGAAARLEHAFRDAVALRYQEGMAWSLNLQGLCSLARREHTRARSQLRASLKLHRGLGDLWRAASVLDALARVAMETGDGARAATLAGAARGVRRRLAVPVPAVEQRLVIDVAGEEIGLDDALTVALED